MAAGERARQLEPVRLDAVGLRRQAPVLTRRLGCRTEAVLLQRQDGRHQLAWRDRRHPLRDGGEVAGVERQHGAAGRFPDAVPIAEAGERRRVPVLDDADPGIAERLAVEGLERRFETQGVLAGRLLRLVAEVLERKGLAAIRVAVGRRAGLAGHRPGGGGGDVGRRERLAGVRGQDLAAGAGGVPAVGIALADARGLVDEERRLELHRVGLGPGCRDVALDAAHPGRDVDRDPALGRRRGRGLRGRRASAQACRAGDIPGRGRRDVSRVVALAAAAAAATLASKAASPVASVGCRRPRAAGDITGGVQSCGL